MGQGHFDTRCEDIWQIWFNKLPAKNPWRSPEWKNSLLWEWPIMNDGSLYNPYECHHIEKHIMWRLTYLTASRMKNRSSIG